MRVAVKNHALPVYQKNRIASLLCIFESTIGKMPLENYEPHLCILHVYYICIKNYRKESENVYDTVYYSLNIRPLIILFYEYAFPVYTAAVFAHLSILFTVKWMYMPIRSCPINCQLYA